MNLAALLRSLQKQQPPLDGPVMGADPAASDGMLGGPHHPAQPPMSLGDVSGLVGGTLADAVQGVTGWRPGTTPEWVPDWMRNLSQSNTAAEQGDQALAGQTIGPHNLPAAVGPDTVNKLLGFAGPVEAYHGSPHSFDKFDMSKIGTGEGAQAYGHGLYFAENEGVARDYRNKLSPQSNDEVAAQAMAEKMGRTWSDMGGYERQQYIDEAKAANLGGTRNIGGSMYQVRINAEPEHFLDWDKPLAGQHPDVQAAIMSKGQESLSGMDAYQRAALTWPGGMPALSKFLNEQGIPGIRYLDQGSRGVGEGTHNYVVFSDKIIDILKKYGLAGLTTALGAGGLAAAAPGQAQASQPELGR